jgi:hypothetical protein
MVNFSSFRGLSLLCIGVLRLVGLIRLVVNSSWSRIYCRAGIWMGSSTIIRHARSESIGIRLWWKYKSKVHRSNEGSRNNTK